MEPNNLSKPLIDNLRNIEDYDPKRDFQTPFNNAKTIWEKQEIIRSYYSYHRSAILSLAGQDPRKFFDVYAFDWDRVFSPIEKYAWHNIRTNGMVLYPQFPVLNYMLDFGNPYLKIGLELDGKEFHSPAKDLLRDENLFKQEDWKIFRVTGSEANKTTMMPDRYPSKYNRNGWAEINDFMNSTLDGVLEAMKQIYFNPNPDVFEWDWAEEEFREICFNTLRAHSLVDYNIK